MPLIWFCTFICSPEQCCTVAEGIQEAIKGKDHNIFSTAYPISNSFLCIIVAILMSGTPLLFSSSSSQVQGKTYLAKDEREGKTRNTSEGSLMCCLKRMHTDHFKDIWRPNGQWPSVAMAATQSSAFYSSNLYLGNEII